LQAKNVSRQNLRHKNFLLHNIATNGPPVTKEQQRAAEVLAEIDHAVVQLPKYAIVKLTGTDEASFNKMQLLAVIRCIQQRALQERWSPVALHKGLLALRQLFAFLDASNIAHEGQTTGALVTLFLLETKEANQAKRKRQEDQEADQLASDEDDPLLPGPILREGNLKQTMAMSGQGKKASLVWAQRNLLMTLGMEDAHLSVGVDMEGSIGGRRNPISAQPFSPDAIQKLEAYATNKDSPPEKAHITGGIVFCILCCLRMAQSQDCWLTGIVSGKYLRGFVSKDKHPNPMKQVSRPFFGVLHGLRGRGWFDVWWSRASKTRRGRFVFEDFTLNGQGILTWLAAPMSYRKLLPLMRQVLVDACVCTASQAKGFTLHSARHTLPLVASLRGVSSNDRQEIGRWSLSVAQTPQMRPIQGVIRRHEIAAAELPDRYAQEADPSFVFDIMEAQVQSMREYVIARGGLHNLPQEENWEYFKAIGQNNRIGIN